MSVFTITLNGRMFDRWEKFDDNFISHILYRIVGKVYKQIKSDMFVADFTRFVFAGFHFLCGSLVGIKAISCFQIVYKFQQVNKSRSLVTVASKCNNYCCDILDLSHLFLPPSLI